MTRHGGWPAVVVLLLAACDAGEARDADARRAGEVVPAGIATDTGSRRLAVSLAPFRSIGRTATAAEIRAWNIDVNASGIGLPPGRGGYERGAAVFAAQCATCHGVKGEGLATNPRLVGAEPRDFSFARDPKIPKTIGNYWPYATTLYDYINRAMPFTAPGSLPSDDIYSLVAFLLAENGIIERNQAMDAASLARIHMPARDRFVADDRTGGPATAHGRW